MVPGDGGFPNAITPVINITTKHLSLKLFGTLMIEALIKVIMHGISARGARVKNSKVLERTRPDWPEICSSAVSANLTRGICRKRSLVIFHGGRKNLEQIKDPRRQICRRKRIK